MKFFTRTFTLALVILPLLVAAPVVMLSGCAKDAQHAALQGEVVIVKSVDAGMKSWHDYVIAGHATQAQVDLVKKEYKLYYDQQMAAKNALKAWVATSDPVKTPALEAAYNEARDQAFLAESNFIALLIAQLHTNKK